MTANTIRICGFLDRAWSPEQLAAIDEIFFTSSATQSFASPTERTAFRERWLGRYLSGDASHAFVAVDEHDRIVGYVVGTITDLAFDPRFTDLSTTRAFATSSARYPAHLHINVAPGMRGQGLGARLIEAFATHATAQGAPGLHVVTSAASRNVRFYARCGFAEIDRVTIAGSEVVFLGRKLPRA
jgi:GNAT superfamily N-acetyltransferase